MGELLMKKKEKKSRNRNKETRSIPKRIIKSVDIPLDVFSNISRIEILENQEIYIEGSEKVLEYDENMIQLKTNKMKLKIFGTGLSMEYLNAENILIKGIIQSIELFSE